MFASYRLAKYRLWYYQSITCSRLPERETGFSFALIHYCISPGRIPAYVLAQHQGKTYTQLMNFSICEMGTCICLAANLLPQNHHLKTAILEKSIMEEQNPIQLQRAVAVEEDRSTKGSSAHHFPRQKLGLGS